jgi:hypothetical protein
MIAEEVWTTRERDTMLRYMYMGHVDWFNKRRPISQRVSTQSPTSSRASNLHMAQGHTGYCGLVRGPHVGTKL